MPFLKFLSKLFLLPGTLAIDAIGITVEEDGGIFRSLINMLFWGALAIPPVLGFALRSV